jgi:hypothetical protein
MASKPAARLAALIFWWGEPKTKAFRCADQGLSLFRHLQASLHASKDGKVSCADLVVGGTK